ncbi:MAG: hypothetical protein KAS67_02700 [Thermoplasmata archaeon]|nr:hypothetical protein [Thermoplasmata archaeon]
MEIEERIVDELENIFDGLARQTVEVQKKKLGLEGELSKENYIQLAMKIKEACVHMVGEPIAENVYNGLVEIIEGS